MASATGGLSLQAISEYLNLWNLLDDFALQRDVEDKILRRWSADGQYSGWAAGRARPDLGDTGLQTGGVGTVLTLILIALYVTRNLRQATICSSPARQVWWTILDALHTYLPAQPADLSLQEWWRLLRSSWSGDKRKGFNSLFALVTWEIWKESNARVFRRVSLTVTHLR